MTDQAQIKIANAFYSNPRKTFLPLTHADMTLRTKLAQDVVTSVRYAMLYDKLIVSRNACQGEGLAIYDLTPKGRELVEAAQ